MLRTLQPIGVPKGTVFMRIGNFDPVEAPYWDRFFSGVDVILPCGEGKDGLTDTQMEYLQHLFKTSPNWTVGLDCLFADPVNRKKVFDLCIKYGRPVIGIHIVGGKPYHPEAKLFRHPAKPTPSQENFTSIYELDLSGEPKLIWSRL